MGQRLVVDLIQNDKVVAAVYYHWSAYALSTISELANLSKAILQAKQNNQNKLLAVIEKLEEDQINYNGEIVCGGVCGRQEELEAAQKLFPNVMFKQKHVNRNYGIISFTQENIDSYHDWEEGHAEINLDTLKITNNVDLDPHPFKFVNAVYETDEDGNEYFSYAENGILRIDDKTSNVDAFDCDCESIIRLNKFILDETKAYYEANRKSQ